MGLLCVWEYPGLDKATALREDTKDKRIKLKVGIKEPKQLLLR
jgi:hypothetical protein